MGKTIIGNNRPLALFLGQVIINRVMCGDEQVWPMEVGKRLLLYDKMPANELASLDLGMLKDAYTSTRHFVKKTPLVTDPTKEITLEVWGDTVNVWVTWTLDGDITVEYNGEPYELIPEVTLIVVPPIVDSYGYELNSFDAALNKTVIWSLTKKDNILGPAGTVNVAYDGHTYSITKANSGSYWTYTIKKDGTETIWRFTGYKDGANFPTATEYHSMASGHYAVTFGGATALTRDILSDTDVSGKPKREFYYPVSNGMEVTLRIAPGTNGYKDGDNYQTNTMTYTILDPYGLTYDTFTAGADATGYYSDKLVEMPYIAKMTKSVRVFADSNLTTPVFTKPIYQNVMMLPYESPMTLLGTATINEVAHNVYAKRTSYSEAEIYLTVATSVGYLGSEIEVRSGVVETLRQKIVMPLTINENVDFVVNTHVFELRTLRHAYFEQWPVVCTIPFDAFLGASEDGTLTKTYELKNGEHKVTFSKEGSNAVIRLYKASGELDVTLTYDGTSDEHYNWDFAEFVGKLRIVQWHDVEIRHSRYETILDYPWVNLADLGLTGDRTLEFTSLEGAKLEFRIHKLCDFADCEWWYIPGRDFATEAPVKIEAFRVDLYEGDVERSIGGCKTIEVTSTIPWPFWGGWIRWFMVYGYGYIWMRYGSVFLQEEMGYSYKHTADYVYDGYVYVIRRVDFNTVTSEIFDEKTGETLFEGSWNLMEGLTGPVDHEDEFVLDCEFGLTKLNVSINDEFVTSISSENIPPVHYMPSSSTTLTGTALGIDWDIKFDFIEDPIEYKCFNIQVTAIPKDTTIYKTPVTVRYPYFRDWLAHNKSDEFESTLNIKVWEPKTAIYEVSTPGFMPEIMAGTAVTYTAEELGLGVTKSFQVPIGYPPLDERATIQVRPVPLANGDVRAELTSADGSRVINTAIVTQPLMPHTDTRKIVLEFPYYHYIDWTAVDVLTGNTIELGSTTVRPGVTHLHNRIDGIENGPFYWSTTNEAIDNNTGLVTTRMFLNSCKLPFWSAYTYKEAIVISPAFKFDMFDREHIHVPITVKYTSAVIHVELRRNGVESFHLDLPIQYLLSIESVIDDFDPHIVSGCVRGDSWETMRQKIYILDDQVVAEKGPDVYCDELERKYRGHILATIGYTTTVPSTHLPFYITSPYDATFRWDGQSESAGTPIENVTNLSLIVNM